MSNVTLKELADKLQSYWERYERMGETPDIIECLEDLKSETSETEYTLDDVYREWKQKYVIDRERHLWERRNK